MSIPLPRRPADDERGAALIAMLLAFLLAGSYFFLRQANSVPSSPERAARTAAALAQAREALVARAVTDSTRPGSLPCPDLITDQPLMSNVPGDGKADLPGGDGQCPSYVGWLPWRTLDLPDLRDAAGERVWYALSPSLRDDDSAQPINSDTPGNLTLDGQGDLAAIVFASHSPLAGQNRPSNTVSDYLDGSNADGNTDYTAAPLGDAFNDMALPLARAELMRAVEPRIAGEAAKCLRAYGATNGYRYPWTTRLNGGGAPSYSDRHDERFGRLPERLDDTKGTAATMSDSWPTNCQISPGATNGWWRNWKELVFYAVANNHKPDSTPLSNLCGVAGYAGGSCLAVNGISNRQFVVLVSGGRLAAVADGQPRSGNDRNNIENYLEGENTTSPSFSSALRSATFNDSLRSYP